MHGEAGTEPRGWAPKPSPGVGRGWGRECLTKVGTFTARLGESSRLGEGDNPSQQHRGRCLWMEDVVGGQRRGRRGEREVWTVTLGFPSRAIRWVAQKLQREGTLLGGGSLVCVRLEPRGRPREGLLRE